MGIKLGQAPGVEMTQGSKPVPLTDLEVLSRIVDDQLGLSEVQLMMLPRQTNFIADVARGIKFNFSEQFALILAHVLGGWAVWIGLSANFVGLTVISAAFYFTLLWSIFQQPVANSWWQAKRKQNEAKEADDVRRSYLEKARKQEDDARRSLGAEILASRLLPESVEAASRSRGLSWPGPG